MTDLSPHISPAYQKFFEQFKEIDSLPIPQWRTTHLLGYFNRLYFAHYGLNFTFSATSTAPSKSTEVYQLKRLAQALSADPVILKDYIDWIFKEKVQLRKKRITSLGFLSTTAIVNDYKFNVLLKKENLLEITRNTILPEKYMKIIPGQDIKTYGDLAFLYSAINSNEEIRLKYDKIFNELYLVGLNKELLGKIK